MIKDQLKLAAISALRQQPDFTNLRLFQFRNDREMRLLLRWLDESGLALYLLDRLQKSGEADQLPPGFVHQLELRLQSNRRRTAAISTELDKLSTVLTQRNIPHAFLKGFTLVPDFCPAIELRHQTDIDILVAAEYGDEASRAILQCGYSAEETFPGGEIQFSKPRNWVPSVHQDVYASEFHPEVDLHISVCRDFDHVVLKVPLDYLSRFRIKEVNGVRFSCLSLEDAFIVQVLHAFRHLLSPWIRVSWLLEIQYFMTCHFDDDSLWCGIKARAGDDPLLRNAFGLTLQLTNRLFPSRTPKILQDWCVESLSDSIKQWALEFGMRWALSDFSGSKLSLFVHREFIQNPGVWRSYMWRRMFPLRGKPSIGRVEPLDIKTSISSRKAELIFFARRAFFHTATLGSFALDAIRWFHLRQMTQKQRAISG